MPTLSSDILILEHAPWQEESEKLAELQALLDTPGGGVSTKRTVYISGCILDRLLEDQTSKALLVKISAAVSRGDLEILGGLYYEPHGALFEAKSIEWQLKRTREIWERLDVTSIDRCFIPAACAHPDLAALLVAAGYTQILPQAQSGPPAAVSPRAARLMKRFREIQKDYVSAYETLAVDGISPIAKARLELALQYICLASHYHPYLAAEIDPAARFTFRKEAFEAILRAQVEIDMALYPTVDPTVGWVTYRLNTDKSTGGEELIVDTQLARIYFDLCAGGAFTEFDYRPRKVDLCNWEELPQASSAIVVEQLGSLVTKLRNTSGKKASSTASLRVLRSAKDILIFNFEQSLQHSLSQKDWAGKLVRRFTFRAGIGAHLPNATTGFSTEFWLEGESPPPDSSLVLYIPLVLPSGDSKAQMIQPLLCVGGVSTERLPLSSEQLILTSAVPGGLYGVRLSDGIEDFTIDLRIAKPAAQIRALPIQGGTELLFVFDASRHCGDERANTLFLSIV